MKSIVNLTILLLASVFSKAQTIVADSLFSATGLEISPQGNVWVALSGSGLDDGAIFVAKPNGDVFPAIVNFPSVLIDTATGETVGPWRTIALPGNKLAVLSPLQGGIVIFDLTGFVPGQSAPLTASSATSVVPISDFVLQNQPMDKQETNPYSAAQDAAGNWYIVDAAFNGVVKVDAATGTRSVFCSFPPFQNPTPIGPPFVDAVPTKILAKPGGGFYVCQLTGFPFLDGAASVYEVSASGAVSTYASGFTLLTDMALDKNTGDLYVLQLAKFAFAPQPGFQLNSAKISRIKPGGTVVETVAEGFGPAVGLALDGQGDLYATHLFFGQILKWGNVATNVFESPKSLTVKELNVFPNPATDAIQFLTNAWDTGKLSIYNARGQMVLSKSGVRSGETIDVRQIGTGSFFMKLETDKGLFGGSFVRL